MLTGTIINALAVLAGSAAGLLLKWLAAHFSSRLPTGSAALGQRLQSIIMNGVALCVLYIGISGALKGNNTLAAILSMVSWVSFWTWTGGCGPWATGCRKKQPA